jgi:hypothetical protein
MTRPSDRVIWRSRFANLESRDRGSGLFWDWRPESESFSLGLAQAGLMPIKGHSLVLYQRI